MDRLIVPASFKDVCDRMQKKAGDKSVITRNYLRLSGEKKKIAKQLNEAFWEKSKTGERNPGIIASSSNSICVTHCMYS